jgi:G3E family GTPase
MDAVSSEAPTLLERTPVMILSGFLGSGKTTLLNRAMRDPAMARTLVVINEFGDISLDHALVASSDDTIMVLENGCLCCTVFGDLVNTLNRAYHQRRAGEIPDFDRVVIETSGLVDPSPVLQAFLSDPTLEGLYRIGGVIVLVDAVNCLSTIESYTESVRQIALADVIIVTKSDLLPAHDASAASAQLDSALRRLNATAKILRVESVPDVAALMLDAKPDPSRGVDEARRWLDLELSGYDSEIGRDTCGGGHAEPGHRHGPAVESFSYVRDEPIPREALQLLLTALERNLGPGLLRVKGLVNVLEEPGRPAVVQGAQHLLHNLVWLDAWPTADERTRLVFIVDTMTRAEVQEMIELVDRVARRTANARLAKKIDST